MPFPIVPLVIAGAQIAQGIAQQGKARKQIGDAKRMNAAIPQYDPNVQRQLETIRQRRLYAEAGQSRMMAYKRRMIEEGADQGDRNISRVAGTSPGSAMMGMLRNRNSSYQALARAGAETEAMAPSYLAMETPLVQDQADRALTMQQYNRDLSAFQGAASQQAGNNMIAGGIGLLSDLEFNGGTKVDTTTAIPSSPLDSLAPKTMPTLGPQLAPPTQTPDLGFGLAGNGANYGGPMFQPQGGFGLLKPPTL